MKPVGVAMLNLIELMRHGIFHPNNPAAPLLVCVIVKLLV